MTRTLLRLCLAVVIIATTHSLVASPARAYYNNQSSPEEAEKHYYFPLVMLTFPPLIGDLRSEWYLMVDDAIIAERTVKSRSAIRDPPSNRS